MGIVAKRSVTNEAGNKFTLMVECDFSGLKNEEIQDYAFDAIWIKEQSNLRSLSNKAFESMNGEYMFKAIPKGTRVAKVMSTDELINAIKGKSKEDRLKAIELLKAME